jgi:thioredoxin 1
MKEINQTEFDELVVKAAKPVLVDFSAEWCPPCKMLKPVIERMSLEYGEKMDFFGVDTDNNIELSQKFMISGVPTMIFFKDGKEVKKLVGFRDYDTLKREIDSLV